MTRNNTNKEITTNYFEEGEQAKAYKQRALKKVFNQKFLSHIIDNIPQSGKFLDAGCGVGSFLRQLIDVAKDKGRNDVEFFAFDYSKSMAEEAQKLNPEAKVFHDDLKNLNSEIGNHSFDYVNTRDVLYFFNPKLGERDAAFKNLSSITKKDGILMVSMREKRFDKEQSSGFFDFSENDLRTIMQKFGFKIEKSEIGNKKSYGSPSQSNLDRFYDYLNIVAVNIGETPSPTLGNSYSATRAAALENKQRGQGGSIKFG